MIELRNIEKSDEALLVEYLNDESVLKYLSSRIPHPYTLEDAAWWVDKGCGKDGVVKAIEYRGTFCGIISMREQLFEHSHSGEVGYWVAREFWGRGIATIALTQFTREIFSSQNIVRLYASVFSGNVGSMKVLQKAGYKHEGTLSCSVKKGGIYFDEYIFAKVNVPS
ncbi:GNAT family N-acetyltransferase [Microbulbifer sp. JTAC008]|uniref:GNAT family N-acetyltransferase n=1 Tax=unclassified Microbulbifer TaxID=2619833 RepID=UPI00403A59BF